MKKILITLILLGLVVLHGTTYAVDVSGLTNIIDNIWTVLFMIGISIIVVMITYGGILFVTATGDPDKISKAKQAILWAIIGGVVIIAANAIKTVIEDIAK